MKKLFFVPFVLMLLFAACSKDSNIIPANENLPLVKEENIVTVIPTDGSVQNRGTCNLYCKVAFRKTATYSGNPSDFLSCFRYYRLIQEDGAGNKVQVFPATGYYPSSPGSTTGTNHTFVVPDTGGYKYYIEFDAVDDPASSLENVFVFFADNIAVHTNPTANADVSWVHNGQIGPAASPDVATSSANVSATCVVTP